MLNATILRIPEKRILDDGRHGLRPYRVYHTKLSAQLSLKLVVVEKDASNETYPVSRGTSLGGYKSCLNVLSRFPSDLCFSKWNSIVLCT